MRSELVFAAIKHVPNRFLLTGLAAMATRKLHRPNTRIQETMDEVFVRFSHASPIKGAQGTGNVWPLRRPQKVEMHSRRAHRGETAA
jgi:hypothetical protein